METTTANIFIRPMTQLSRVTLTQEEQNGVNIKTMTIGEFLNPQYQGIYGGLEHCALISTRKCVIRLLWMR